MFKVNNKDIRTTPFSTVKFEQVNASWEVMPVGSSFSVTMGTAMVAMQTFKISCKITCKIRSIKNYGN